VSASFSELFRPQQFHASLVSRQSFPHLWKNLWKIDWNRRAASIYGLKRPTMRLSEPSTHGEYRSKVSRLLMK